MILPARYGRGQTTTFSQFTAAAAALFAEVSAALFRVDVQGMTLTGELLVKIARNLPGVP
jgi:hypothetical protein